MNTAPTNWTAQQLTDFVAAVSSAGDERRAIRYAAERACRAFAAEVAAIVGEGEVMTAAGLGGFEVPAAELIAAAAGDRPRIEVPEAGECVVLSTPVGDERLHTMILARPASMPFSSEEVSLARGMARVVGLTVRLHRLLDAERGLRELSERQARENERLVDSLAERQRLLERLSKIQSSIVSRRDLAEVFAAIVEGAKDLLGDETVGVRLIDPEDPGRLELVACAGVAPEIVEEHRFSPIGMGAGGLAAEQDRLVVIDDYAASERGLEPFAADGIRAACAAPVRDGGRVVGSLVVATHRAGRTYSQAEREMLVALAEHASLALANAKTIEERVHLAFHDSLTGLPNRALLMDRLEHALARASRQATRVAVLFVDLDGFKTVNDTLGHAAGDQLLREAAGRLVGCVRAADTAARFGGDEFVVLLEGADDADVTRTANRVLEAMAEPFMIEARELRIGASIGIAVGSSEAEDLLRNADLALYRAKARGRGQMQVFEPAMHVEMVGRLELESQLAAAMREDALVLYYQPIIDLMSERLIGVEALVRWQHPERDLLAPKEFLAVAEHSRLIVPLGRWVLRAAAAQLAAWRRAYPAARQLFVSVNFSSAQFADPELAGEVTEILAAAALPPDRLIVELAETAFLNDPEAIAARMQELRELGARIAVDDFGTGNVSLQHLARFPVDMLKVDPSFVHRLEADARHAAVAGSIVRLGESLRMTVIGEGIETARQHAKLLALGCDLGQGFHLARPAPAAEIGRLLAGPAEIATAGAGGTAAEPDPLAPA